MSEVSIDLNTVKSKYHCSECGEVAVVTTTNGEVSVIPMCSCGKAIVADIEAVTHGVGGLVSP